MSTRTYEALAARRANALAQIKRFELGTDPDLPDDQKLRERLLAMHRMTVTTLDNTLASMQAHGLVEPEDFV